MLVWENNRRLKKLIAFRKLVIVYFNNSHQAWIMDPRVEEEAAQEARSNINSSMEEAHSTILQSETNPKLTNKAPPTAGGYASKIDLIENILNLHEIQKEPNKMYERKGSREGGNHSYPKALKVVFTEKQAQFVVESAERLGISWNEFVRHCIDECMSKQSISK